MEDEFEENIEVCVLKNDFIHNLEVVEGEFEDKRHGCWKVLWVAEYFFDVTLACDDDYIRVHKMIQISCSELFHIVYLNNRTLRLEKTIEISKNLKA